MILQDFISQPAKQSHLRWWGVLLGSALLFQVCVAASLNIIRGDSDRQISDDLSEYRLYVDDPWVLLGPLEGTPIYGGRFASPLMPVMYAYPYRMLNLIFDEFLAFRFAAIGWACFGLGLALSVALRDYGVPRGARETWLALGITVMPILWLASAVLSQDDCIAGGWSGILVWAWRRLGIWGCVTLLAAAVWGAKIFMLLHFLGLWIGYPQQRWRLVAAGTAVLASLLTFFYWRDGSLASINQSMAPYMGGTLYALGYILYLPVSGLSAQEYSLWTKSLAVWMTGLALAGWSFLGWRKSLSLPSAIVGSYSLFFSFFIIMMPEYEMWYLGWIILVMWAALKQRDWLTYAFCWMHSFWGYAYKICYSADSQVFPKTSALQAPFKRYFDFDLTPLLVICALGTVLSAIWLAIRLWRHDPTRKYITANLAH